jgi:hypothetical protein
MVTMSPDNPDGPAKGLVPAEELDNLFEKKEQHIVTAKGQDSEWAGMILDTRDPIEEAISELIYLYRHRRPAMVIGGDVFATFANSAKALDIPAFGAPEALLLLIQQEQVRINAMRRSNTLYDPGNADSLGAYMELAFHANILFAWVRRYVQGYR